MKRTEFKDKNNDAVKLLNTTEVIDEIGKIIAKARTPEMRAIKQEQGFEALLNKMITVYPAFYIECPTLFRLALKDADPDDGQYDYEPLEFLATYMYGIDQVKAGKKSIEEVELILGEKLKKRFIDPIITK